MCARHHAGYVALPPQGPRGDGFSYAKCQPATDLWGFMLNDYLAPSAVDPADEISHTTDIPLLFVDEGN
jgi:hypothetical protein